MFFFENNILFSRNPFFQKTWHRFFPNKIRRRVCLMGGVGETRRRDRLRDLCCHRHPQTFMCVPGRHSVMSQTPRPLGTSSCALISLYMWCMLKQVVMLGWTRTHVKYEDACQTPGHMSNIRMCCLAHHMSNIKMCCLELSPSAVVGPLLSQRPIRPVESAPIFNRRPGRISHWHADLSGIQRYFKFSG